MSEFALIDELNTFVAKNRFRNFDPNYIKKIYNKHCQTDSRLRDVKITIRLNENRQYLFELSSKQKTEFVKDLQKYIDQINAKNILILKII